ncbi:TVP38/TMEM64 family protein [Pseudobacteriovorax antillogorgiicola]|nr:VTT domain-containing protein [Pseudobacteriovorax antillogorgiicola]
MRNRIIIFIAVLGLSTVLALGFAIFADKQVLLDLVILKANQVQLLTQQWPILSVLAYGLLYIILVTCSVPGMFLLTVLCGATFGWPGLSYTALSATLGSLVAFYMSRYWFRAAVLRNWGHWLMQINHMLESHGTPVLITVRLFTIIPYYIVNLVSGLTTVSSSRFFLTTLVGMLPVHAVFINAGTKIAEIKVVADIWTPKMILSIALLGVLPLIATILKRSRNFQLDHNSAE